ncbi:hypothetical protein [Calothrix rhizosoleniae]|uniref:hypothetical protein n=1 Tax=Calothrix rhizosoleniae TaxID=888997 RepID=UPI000B49AC67|nr:hypothetical protein [Calothrix rhizosoleniae]
MKRFLIAGLGTLLLTTAATPVFAREIATSSQESRNQVTRNVKPFNLVFLGYQGYFQEQGIPSNGAFVNRVRYGDISAEDLVKSAIALGRLSPDTINNRIYLNAVANQLNSISRQ